MLSKIKLQAYITEYFPLFLEALASIIMFYTAYTLYTNYLFLPYMDYIFQQQFNKQTGFYNIKGFASSNAINNDIASLKWYNSFINNTANIEESKISKYNKDAINNLVILVACILGILIIITCVILLSGYYNWRKIDFKLLLFTFIFHAIFIFSLETYLFFVVIGIYPQLKISNLIS